MSHCCNEDDDDLWVNGLCKLAALKAANRGSTIFVNGRAALSPDVDGIVPADEIDGFGIDGVLSGPTLDTDSSGSLTESWGISLKLLILCVCTRSQTE